MSDWNASTVYSIQYWVLIQLCVTCVVTDFSMELKQSHSKEESTSLDSEFNDKVSVSYH